MTCVRVKQGTAVKTQTHQHWNRELKSEVHYKVERDANQTKNLDLPIPDLCVLRGEVWNPDQNSLAGLYLGCAKIPDPNTPKIWKGSEI